MGPEGLHVAAIVRDGSPTVVFVHGAPDRSDTFDRVLPYLPEFSVVTYDRRGYAASLAAGPPSGMVEHARDLLDIAERFPGPRIVVAHSFGSNPTMLATTLQPNAFASIGLWEPPLPWVQWWPESTKRFNDEIVEESDPGAASEAMYRRLLGDSRWERLPSAAQNARRAEGVALQRDMASELVKPFDFAEVKAPALVGHGSETSQAHAYGAAWLSEQLPDGHHVVIDGAGHFAHRTHPEEFASFVQQTAALIGG